MIAPNDPRHGTRAGYQAHRKADEDACAACLRGRGREDKVLRVEHHRGARMEYTAAEVQALIEPWLAMGLSYGSIGTASGLGGQQGSRLAERIAAGHWFRRATYAALAGVTEDDFQRITTVHADLTRTRIRSLMAAGHPLTSMPVALTGKWRYQPAVTVELAARIRDYYAAHQFTIGDSVLTRNRARDAGYPLPAAWDDPGTLAWPLGWTSAVVDQSVIDEVAVQRILGGECTATPRTATPAERVEVVRRWRAAGRGVNELERLTGWKPERYYTPDVRETTEVA